jgi:hypothetical protein
LAGTSQNSRAAKPSSNARSKAARVESRDSDEQTLPISRLTRQSNVRTDEPTTQASGPSEGKELPEDVELPTNPVAAPTAAALGTNTSEDQIDESSEPTREQNTELFRLRQPALVPSQPPGAFRKSAVLQIILALAVVAAFAIFFVVSRSLRPETAAAGAETPKISTDTRAQPEPARIDPVSTPAERTETTAAKRPSESARQDGKSESPAEERAVPGFDAAMKAAVTRALNCHRGGRANGTVEIIFTLTPRGRAKNVRLEGEPIASAPVGVCVISQIKALLVPPFEGPGFTVRRTITLTD